RCLIGPSLPLIRRQKVHVNVQNQGRQGGPVNLVRADRSFRLGGSGRHVPAAVLVLGLQQELTHCRVPFVPVLAAGLVVGLDGIVVKVIEIVGAVAREQVAGRLVLRQVIEGLFDLGIVVLAQELHGEGAGGAGLGAGARSAVAKASAARVGV